MFTLKWAASWKMKWKQTEYLIFRWTNYWVNLSDLSGGLRLILKYRRPCLNLRRACRYKVGFSTVATDGWLSFKTDCHLLLWLHFSATSLNMRLLIHTNLNNCTHRRTHTHTHTHTHILTDWKRQTLITTHTLRWTHTHTHIHHTRRTLVCTSFSLTSSFCQWCTCVFVSKCSAKRVTSKNDLLSSSCFSF